MGRRQNQIRIDYKLPNAKIARPTKPSTSRLSSLTLPDVRAFNGMAFAGIAGGIVVIAGLVSAFTGSDAPAGEPAEETLALISDAQAIAQAPPSTANPIDSTPASQEPVTQHVPPPVRDTATGKTTRTLRLPGQTDLQAATATVPARHGADTASGVAHTAPPVSARNPAPPPSPGRAERTPSPVTSKIRTAPAPLTVALSDEAKPPVLTAPTSATRTVARGGSIALPPPNPLHDPLRKPTPAAKQKAAGSALTLTVARGDSLDSLFRAHGLKIQDLHAMLALAPAKQGLKLIKPGDQLLIQHQDDSVLALRRRVDEANTLVVTRTDGAFAASIEPDELEYRLVHARGRISSSLFNAGKAAGVSDQLVMALAGIFAWDIDFVLDIRQNDEFVMLYQQVWRDGEFLRDGVIVVAEFINDGRAYQAVRYVDDEEHADYYSPDGLSMRKAFLRAPVDFSRISSNFNPRRRHPVLNTIRAHTGVDYAAPKGTPIKAAGDGKVLFRGKKGGYGNAIVLQHGGNITTLYAHMSKFAKPRVGQRVKQGQTIGYVGQTGLASGPHLHYEYRVSGVHRNPRTVKLPQAEPIPTKYKTAFLAHAENRLKKLALVRDTRLAASFD